MALNNPDLIFNELQKQDTALVFGFEDNTSQLFLAATIVTVGNIVAEISSSSVPISGNDITSAISPFTSVSQTVDIAGNESYVPYGFIGTTAECVQSLSGNSTTSALNSVTSLQLLNVPISSNGFVLATGEAEIIGSPTYWSPVQIMLRGEGTSGTVPTDTSPIPKSITNIVLAQTSLSNAQSKFGTSSIVFSGAADSGFYLTNTAAHLFEFGSNDFTIETWVRINSNSGSLQTIFSSARDWFHVRRGGIGGFGACWGGTGSWGDYNNGPMQPTGGDAPAGLYSGFYRIGGAGGAAGSLSYYGGGGGGAGGNGYYGGGGGSGSGGWWGSPGAGGAGGSSYVSSLLTSAYYKHGDETFNNYDGVSRAGSSVHGARITNTTTSAVTSVPTGGGNSITTTTGHVYMLECWGQPGTGCTDRLGGKGGYAVGYFTATNNTDVLYIVATNATVSSGGTSATEVGGAGGQSSYIQLNNSTLLAIAGGGGGAGGAGSAFYGGQRGTVGGPAGRDGTDVINSGAGLHFGVRGDIGMLTTLVRFTDNTSVSLNEATGGLLTAGTWHHVVLARNGTTLKLMRNGVITGSRNIGTKSISGYNTASVGFNVSYWNSERRDSLAGYLDDLKVTVGYDQYATQSVVPTATPKTFNETTNLDAFYALVSLLLTNEDRSAPTNIIDWAPTPNVITCTNGALVSATNPKSGTTSIDLSATNATLSFPANANFNFGTGNFTIEMWVKRLSTGQDYGHLFSYGTTQTVFNLKHFTSDVYLYHGATSTTIAYAAGALPVDTWKHIAVVRSGNTFTIFVDGVSSATGTNANACGSSTGTIYIGNGYGVENFRGYLDDIRVTKYARYTNTFTPNTAPLPVADTTPFADDPYLSNVSLLLHNNGTHGSTTFTDSSTYSNVPVAVGTAQITTAISKFGTGSIFLDGSGSVTVPDATHFEMGSGDYTVECWYYPIGNNDCALVSKGMYNTAGYWSSAGWCIRRFSNTAFRFYFSVVNTTEKYFDATVTENVGWNHVAMVVRNSVGYAYLNGVFLGKTLNVDTIPDSAEGITIGKFPYVTVNLAFNGYIDEVRITKGIARYIDAAIVGHVGTPIVTISMGSVSTTCGIGSITLNQTTGAIVAMGVVGTITTSQALTRNISTTVVPSAAFPENSTDLYWNDVVLLAHGNGGNGAIFVDSSSSPKSLNVFGNAQITTVQSKFGGSSMYFDGTGDYITAGSPADWTFLHDGTSWTCEGWFNFTNYTSGPSLISTSATTSDSGMVILVNSSRQVIVQIYRAVNASLVLNYTSNSVIPADTNFHHIAVTYDHNVPSNNCSVYIDGVLAGQSSKTGNAPSLSVASNTLHIGTYGGNTSLANLNGFADDIRITKGVVRYTGSHAQINSIAGNLQLPIFSAGLTGFTSTVTAGTITPTLTENFTTKVTATCQLGAITVSQQLTRELIGTQTTVIRGDVATGASLGSTEITTEIGSVVASITENFATKNTITGSVGTVLTTNTTTFGISGNQINSAVNNPYSTNPLTGNGLIVYAGNVIAEHSFGEMAVGYVGNITTSQTVTFGITGNLATVSTSNLGDISSSNIAGNVLTTSIDSVTPSITANFATKNTITCAVGTVTVSQAVEKLLNGNSLTGIAGSTYQSFPYAIAGHEAVSGTGTVTDLLTENFCAPNTIYCQLGTITTTNTQQKAIDGTGPRMICTGHVGSVVPIITAPLTTIVANSATGIITPSLTENFMAPNVSVVTAGTISTQSTTTSILFGNGSNVDAGNIYPTRFNQLAGNQINSATGLVKPKSSLGVKSNTAVGSISTSMTVEFTLNSNQTNMSIGELRNFKYANLTGNQIDALLNVFTDVHHSLGVRSVTAVGTFGVEMSIDTYPTGVQANEGTGFVFATQTVDLTGVGGVGAVNTSPEVTHSLGVLATGSIGTIGYTRSYDINGHSITTHLNNVSTSQAITFGITGNHTTGKLHQEMGPDLVVLGTHYETEIPRNWSIDLRGEFTTVQSFKCINNPSKLIETYFVGKSAWIQLQTPGSFASIEAHYLNEDGSYGVAYDKSEVPEEAMVYNLVQHGGDQLIFELAGTYDDGGPQIPFKRTYIINIVVDYSIERDLVGLGVL